MITHKRLKESLSYDQHTGVFTWVNPSKFHSEKVGSIAGTVTNSRGKNYLVIRIDGRGYKAHRLAYLYVHGVLPKIVDHKDGDSLNNKISNIRSCSAVQNNQNHIEKIKDNGLPTGVSTTVSGKYRARITVNKKVILLGVFTDKVDAYIAYTMARDEMHDAPVRFLCS